MGPFVKLLPQPTRRLDPPVFGFPSMLSALLIRISCESILSLKKGLCEGFIFESESKIFIPWIRCLSGATPTGGGGGSRESEPPHFCKPRGTTPTP